MMPLNGQHQPTVDALKRYTKKLDAENDQVTGFFDAQAHGEPVDADKFMQLLQRHMVTQQVMEAQFKLHDKPMQVVLNESK